MQSHNKAMQCSVYTSTMIEFHDSVHQIRFTKQMTSSTCSTRHHVNMTTETKLTA